MGASPRRLARTALDMFAIIRAERADLMVVSAFAAIIALVADRVILSGIELISPDAAAALSSLRPDLRPIFIGVACAGVLLAFCLRPFWIRAAAARRPERS